MKEYKPLPRGLEQIINELGFSISYDGNMIEFDYIGSDINYDFIFSCNNVAENKPYEDCDDKTKLYYRIGEIANNIYSAYENYDVSHETYLWLDSDGHGKNGAPYDMKDVYDEMVICKSMIAKVWVAVHRYQDDILKGGNFR